MIDLSPLAEIDQGHALVVSVGNELLLKCSGACKASAVFKQGEIWRRQGYKATLIYEYKPGAWAIYESDGFEVPA